MCTNEKDEEGQRERETRTRNQILSFSGEGFQVEISRGTKSKLVFVRYSLGSLAYVVIVDVELDLINSTAESEARTDSLSLGTKALPR